MPRYWKGRGFRPVPVFPGGRECAIAVRGAGPSSGRCRYWCPACSSLRPVPFLERRLRFALQFAAEFTDAVFQVLPARGFFRDQNDGLALFADENLVALKAEFLGQPHRLAVALLEYLGCFHGKAPEFVYTVKYTHNGRYNLHEQPKQTGLPTQPRLFFL